MRSIDVDNQVFEALGRHARPFLDTPNDVLRRLLGIDTPSGRPSEGLEVEDRPLAEEITMHRSPMSPALSKVDSSSTPPPLAKIFKYLKGSFRRVPPYRLMFREGERLLYVQNFGKRTNHLWYRVTAKPWKDLRTHQGDAWLCLSYPEGGVFYLIPVRELAQMVQSHGWGRDYLEINIDPASSRWTELGVVLTSFKHQIDRE